MSDGLFDMSYFIIHVGLYYIALDLQNIKLANKPCTPYLV